MGESADNFCKNRCGTDIVSSNNNSDYNFIRCECVLEIVKGDAYVNKVVNIKTDERFFDSETGEEMNKSEILDRINK